MSVWRRVPLGAEYSRPRPNRQLRIQEAMADQQTLPRPLVQGPSAWIGAELAKRPEEWTYHLSGTELAEIAAATEACRGRDIASITRDDFPLPTSGAGLERL